MPVVRTPISVSQLADLVGCDTAAFIAVERRVDGWYVVTEDGDVTQTTGTFPQAHLVPATGTWATMREACAGCTGHASMDVLARHAEDHA